MKYQILIFLSFLNVNLLFSQKKNKTDEIVKTYQEAIDAGNKAVENKEFNKALDYFFAAIAYEPAKRDSVETLINKVFNEIQQLKKDAEAAKEEAENAEKLAKDALEEAKRQTEIADTKTKEAIKSEKDAKDALEEAEKAKIAEIAARKVTQDALEEVKNEKKIADQKTREAIASENKAELLRIEELSTSTALKSIAIEYDREAIKGLLAIEAFNMQMTMIEDTRKENKTWVAPEIYTALHDAAIMIRGDNYDEFPKVDTGHIGPVRAIFQIDENSFYSVGSDGRLLLWKIKKWHQNGKPTLEKIVSVRKEEEIITAASIYFNGEKGKELIAIGSRFSEVELIKSKNDKSKISKNKKKRKNRGYNYERLHRSEIEEVCDMVFVDSLLYVLEKNSTIKTYDLKKEKVNELIRLKKENGEHIAIHPNGSMIAVGYKNGNIDLFEIAKPNKLLHQLIFKKEELIGKEITALTFDDKTEQLFFGTNDGYIGLVPMIDTVYNIDSVKLRKEHSFLISAIGFKTFVDSNTGKDSTVMVVGSYDGTVSVWLLSEFENLLYNPFLFDDKSTFVTSLEFVNNPTDEAHNQLMVGYFDGTIKFWNMNINSLADDLKCYLGKAKLSDDEMKNYHLDTEGFEAEDFAKCKNEK